MSRKILVTGGFGFIGSHLVERLLADSENYVHVVDNLSTSPIDVNEFLDLLGHPNRLTHDLCSIEEYYNRLEDIQGFQQIYHLASVVGPVGILPHAGRIVGMIVNDTYRVADLALREGAKVLDVSTSEVYGGGRDGYCSENDFLFIKPKVSVRLEYAVGKLASEVALINTSRASSLEVTIIRPFNVAGPRQSGKGGFVLPRFISQALAGQPLTVYHDGSMIRAFTHVKDIVYGLCLAMEKGTNGMAYNIGNPANKTSILDLAQRVIELTKSQSEISFVDPKQLFGPLYEEANDKYPDAQRAIDELGWQPEYGISETILETAEYIQSGRKA